MPTLIAQPTIITAAGNKPKRIEEFFGRVNSKHDHISVARMVSPAGWQEPGQKPEFQEMTVVLQGLLRVEYEGGVLDVQAGQAIVTEPGNGFGIARRMAQSILQSAYPPFHQRRFIGMLIKSKRCD